MIYINRLNCQASLSALIIYLEVERSIFLKPLLLNIEYQQNEDGTFIDSGTCKFLELITNNSGKNKNLYYILNNCATKNGMNMLRSCILEPPTSLNLKFYLSLIYYLKV